MARLRPVLPLVTAGLIGSLVTSTPRAAPIPMPPGVQVTPDGSSTPNQPPFTNGYSAVFTVKNTKTTTATFTLTRESSSNITTTGQSHTIVTLAPSATINVTVYYNVGAPGAGWVQLWAEGSGAFDSGTWNVPVPTAKVTPDGATAPERVTNTGGYSETFTIKNQGTTTTSFTLSCTGSSNLTCSGVTPGSVNLGAGAQTTAAASYSVGATGTGTLTLTATGGALSDNGSYSVPVVSYAVAVTPDSGEAIPRRPNGNGFGHSFTVTNTGTASQSFTFTCASMAPVTCAQDAFGNHLITPSSASLDGGAQTTVMVGFTTGETGTGRLYLGASGSVSSDQGWVWVPVTSATVGVTPANAWTPGAFTSTSNTGYFVVSNPTTVVQSYVLGCYASVNVVCPTSSLPTLVMAGNESQNVGVGYSVGAGASGNGWIHLVVNGNELGPGKLNFTIWPNVPYGVSVTPVSGTGPARGSFTNGHTQSFTVRNVGINSDTYTLTCEAPTGVTCVGVNPTSKLLASLDTVVVTVTYNTGASGSVYARLRAQSASVNNTGQVNFSVVPSAGYAVAVTPDAKGIGVLPSTGTSYPFSIANPGTLQNSYTITAACTGSAIASGCTPSPTSVTIPAGGTSTATVSYTSGGPSTTGTIKLRVKQSSDSAVKDSGWVNLATGTAQAPAVTVSAVNPGTEVERDLCLTVALAGAAAECGDLRLAHALPAVRTMGRARVPTLVYSSAYAHPYPLVAAEVTIPAGAANPDSVEAVLKLNGVVKRTARWGGSAFSPGRANRIVIGYDALNDSTGVYSYTLEVKSLYPGSSLSASPIPAGQFILVNRSQSEFGSGWWLAGLERIRLDSMLWVGGDGSARVYRTTGISNTWAATALDRPDTLKKVGTEYVRLLPAKAEVWFDAQGRHVRTVSRLRHDTTWFHRNASNGKVDSITVPPFSQTVRYRFKYNASGRLDSVIAPPAGALPRAAKLTLSGSQVTAIRDPDTSSVSFGYDGGYANRIISRTDRVAAVARYFFDAAGKVVRDSLDPSSSQPVIARRLRSHESAGFIGSPALDTAVASAAVDGPRTDVGDSTLFWLDRFGAPRRVRDALGAETSVRRENASFPALVTRTQGPNGRVMRATYNSRGHVLTVTDSGTIVNGQVAVTRYGWNTTWDADTLVVPPENDSTVIGIEAATGHRLWQQDASGSASRVNFTYYANGLLATAREPGAALVTTLNYDTRGNLRETISPLGFRDSVYTDNLGRDTLTVGAPLNGAQAKQRQRTVYDLRDRVITTVTTVPALPYTLSGITPDTTPVAGDTVIVQTSYDREGRPVFVASQTIPDRGAGTGDEVRTYDRAGRLLSKKLGSGPASFTYDAAGNAITQTYRGAGGATVTSQFDALNRLVQRVTPRRAYPRTDCTGHPAGPLGGNPCLMRFPYFPNIVGDSLEIPADTAVFAYDVAGNLAQADNKYAQVRRSYQPNGLMATDTLRLRNYTSSSFGTHAYQLRYGYDRNGRRAWMVLGGTAGADSLTYLYSAANGALAHVIDAANRRYSLTYTPAGRVDSLKVYPNAGAYPSSPGIRESRLYDADGRMTRRERRAGSGSGTVLQLDSLWYDVRGKVSKAATSSAAAAQGTLTTTLAYAGLGAVVASHVQSSSSPYWNLEEFRADAVGNIWYQHTRYAASAITPSSVSNYTANGLLKERIGARPTGCAVGIPHVDSLYQLADLQGNVIRAGELRNSGCDNHASDRQTATNSYYGADNRLGVVQRQSSTGPHSWEEYWYDALGRRVLTRARHELPTCSYSGGCAPFVERTVWDGEQLLVEQRTSGLDLIAGAAPEHGTVRYVHMLGIDQPVAVLDNRFTGARVLHYNWRGLAEASSWADGTPADAELGGATTIAWPAGQGVYFREVSPTSPSTPTWIGSLPANGSGTAGLLYRRNRYYDPASGRFTQEDPIGLGGGLNLYGFAGGDPVNYSDPFGLCVEDACVLEAGAGAAVATLVVATAAAAILQGDNLGQAADAGLEAGKRALTGIMAWARKKTAQIRREWEALKGQPWPVDASGKPHEADHDQPVADGGSDTADNVTPRPHDEHVQRHKDRGDFSRWGRRGATQKTQPDKPKEPNDP